MKDYLDGRKRVDLFGPEGDSGEQVVTPKESAVTPPAEDEAEPMKSVRVPCAEGGPQVEAVMSSGRVRRIIVTCTCGERVELECDY